MAITPQQLQAIYDARRDKTKNILSLRQRNITNDDLAAIADFCKTNEITALYLRSNEQITDITPLAGLTNLTVLNLSSTNVSDIRPLAGLTKLTELNLYDTNVSDLSPLAGLTNLKWLSLWNTNVSQQDRATAQARSEENREAIESLAQKIASATALTDNEKHNLFPRISGVMSTLSNSPHNKTPEDAQKLIIKAAPELKTYFVQTLLQTTCQAAWRAFNPDTPRTFKESPKMQPDALKEILTQHKKIGKHLTWQDTTKISSKNIGNINSL